MLCTADGCFFCLSAAARPFHARDGNGTGNQGMLHVELVDNQTGLHVIVACTHLKAKGGEENDAARKHQVRDSLYVPLIALHAHLSSLMCAS
jgi:negative regulator of genetic competence, sporulation and motility